jgi:hypothetical protein
MRRVALLLVVALLPGCRMMAEAVTDPIVAWVRGESKEETRRRIAERQEEQEIRSEMERTVVSQDPNFRELDIESAVSKEKARRQQEAKDWSRVTEEWKAGGDWNRYKQYE